MQRSGAGTAAAWRKLGQWVAAGKVPEQMPEARTCRKELEHVSATRLIIAHWVLSRLTQALSLGEGGEIEPPDLVSKEYVQAKSVQGLRLYVTASK